MTVQTWARVCALEALTPDRGVAALLGDEQVAIFRLSPDDDVVAIGNHDPFSGAAVLSRGIIGSKGDVITVASPVYKQRFDVLTGVCLDDESVSVRTYAARVTDGWIEVALA
jgi:nitrite reductase (NADH) small subunit